MNVIVNEQDKSIDIKAPAVKLDIEEMEAATPVKTAPKEKSCLCHDGATSSLSGTCVI